MKVLFSLLAFLLIASNAFSQTPSSSTVTIKVLGNRTKQVAVDNQYYTINSTGVSQEQVVTINDLASGQHLLEIFRNNKYNKSYSTKTNFTLRQGYDLTISVSANGSLSTTEQKIDRWQNGGTKTPVTNAVFTKLLAATKKKTSSVSRADHLSNEFTNTSKFFTSQQASLLIQLVNSESLRLKLAKQVYVKITDRDNFNLVSNLLKSTANKTDLSNYIAALPDEDEDDDNLDIDDSDPLTNEEFTVIYAEVKAETTLNDKYYYLINFFGKDYRYYTSTQAGQLIQLISGEQERFSLAKEAYRGVTDRENYGIVYPLLNTSNRSALVAYINSYDNNNVQSPMATPDYNRLYQSVYYQNSSTARYTAINQAFTNAGNYFNVAQAKKLIVLVNDESSRLILAKIVYKILVDRADYAQFNDFLPSASSRTELNNYVINYNNSGQGTGLPMSEVDYNYLYKSVSDAWSTSTRVNLITTAFNKTENYFSTYQVRQLLLLLSFENDRLVLAKNSYANVTDHYNFSQLYDILSTTNSKNDLAQFVANMEAGGTITVKIPMSETAFNSIYRDIQFRFGIGAKMSALSTVFSTETNYFTVQQARQLIEMVSLESNRLELAKSSYNNITDPANFSQLYDIFSTQASRDELMAFVNNNVFTN
ncbi:MAG: DUF4476 domain-containing protein [Bacteroidota bacterium]|nr:DUF4476 domain-containing protein [Bacteroidota bacterium]